MNKKQIYGEPGQVSKKIISSIKKEFESERSFSHGSIIASTYGKTIGIWIISNPDLSQYRRAADCNEHKIAILVVPKHDLVI